MPIGCVSARCCCSATVGICNCLVHEAKLRSVAATTRFYADGEPGDWRCNPAASGEVICAVNRFLGKNEYFNGLTGFAGRCMLAFVACELEAELAAAESSSGIGGVRPADEAAEREAFEAWAAERWPGMSLSRRLDGSYWDTGPDAPWEAWQERARRATDGVAPASSVAGGTRNEGGK
jgi:hypothetical protein